MEYPKFKVCVRCFTFNQAKYIEDALNGFAMQKTDFPFVCCIVDDASTDGEQEVIKKYMNMHFDYSPNSVSFDKETDYAYIHYAQHKENKNCHFAVLFLKENLYSKNEGNKKFGYISEWRKKCEYEAFCEGDDYWINPDKLHKQVKYMDENSDCGLTYSYFGTKDEINGNVIENAPLNDSEKYPMVYSKIDEFIVSKGYVAPPTWVYRLDLFDTFQMIPYSKDGTFCMFCHFFLNSKVFCFKDVFAIYRLLQESACHSKNPQSIYIRDKNILETQIGLIKRYELSHYLIELCISNYYSMSLPFFIANGFVDEIAKANEVIYNKSLRDIVMILLSKTKIGCWLVKFLYKYK